MTMLEKIPCRTLIKVRKKRSHSGIHILRNKKNGMGLKSIKDKRRMRFKKAEVVK